MTDEKCSGAPLTQALFILSYSHICVYKYSSASGVG
jgi:hypothetical protein